jgi:glutathione peroxidase
MSLLDVPINSLEGQSTSLRAHENEVVLAVNVASKCGLTPQYEGLEQLQKEYGPRGFTVLGFPCNQFLGQEPGSAEEIREFCSTTYGVSFPLTEKIDVNGDDRHGIYDHLTSVADSEGHAGDIRWNFEKFLIARGGQVVARFAPLVDPHDPALIAAIEEQLAS